MEDLKKTLACFSTLQEDIINALEIIENDDDENLNFEEHHKVIMMCEKFITNIKKNRKILSKKKKFNINGRKYLNLINEANPLGKTQTQLILRLETEPISAKKQLATKVKSDVTTDNDSDNDSGNNSEDY
jgi:hypothetical protein